MPIPATNRVGGPLPDGGSPDPAGDHNLLARAMLSGRFDVHTFGDADNTGGSSALAALDDAHDYVSAHGGGVLYVPPGLYAIEDVFAIGTGVGIVGAGAGVTVFVRTDPDACVQFGTPETSIAQGPISGGFDVVDEDSIGNPAYFGDLGGTCVKFGRFALRVFEQVRAVGGAVGLEFLSTQNSTFRSCYSTRSSEALLVVDGGAQDLLFEKLNLSRPGPGAVKARISGRVPHGSNPAQTFPELIRFRSGIFERESGVDVDQAPALVVEAGEKIIIDDVSFNDSLVAIQQYRRQHWSTDPASPYYDPGDPHFGAWLPNSVIVRSAPIQARGPFGIELTGEDEATGATEIFLADLTSLKLEDIAGIRSTRNTRIRTGYARTEVSTPTMHVGAVIFAALSGGASTVVLRAGTSRFTAVSGGASTVVLPSDASAVNGHYSGTVAITAGTGAGQTRTISGYVGGTRTVTVSVAWSTQPDATSTIAIDDPDVDDPSATDDHYPPGGYVSILDGTGAGQYREIDTYVGVSRTVTVVDAWDVVPDATSRIVIDDPDVHSGNRVRPVNATAPITKRNDSTFSTDTLAPVEDGELETWGRGTRIVELVVRYSGPSGVGAQLSIDNNGGGSFKWSVLALAPAETDPTAAPIMQLAELGDSVTVGTAGVSTELEARIRGTLDDTAAQGSTLTLSAAQGAPDASPVTIYADGFVFEARDVLYTVKQAT